MKSRAAALALTLILILGPAGCSDDDCQTCPTTEISPELFVIGSAVFDPPDILVVLIDVFNTAGTDRCVESAKADDMPLCVSDVPAEVSGDGHQLVRTLGGEYCPTGVIDPFFATATTRFEFVCDDEVHFAELHLLDPGVTPGALTATADPESDTLDIDWAPVADAEWYSVKVRSKLNFAGPWIWDFYVVEATSVTVPLPLSHSQLNDARIYVAACTGAQPEATGPEHNVQGPYMTGNVYSVSGEAYFYLELTPLVLEPGVAAGERIEPPTIRELVRARS